MAYDEQHRDGNSLLFHFNSWVRRFRLRFCTLLTLILNSSLAKGWAGRWIRVDGFLRAGRKTVTIQDFTPKFPHQQLHQLVDL